MAGEAMPRPRWRKGGPDGAPAKIARVAYVLAPIFGRKPKTISHWLDELPDLCGRIVQRLRHAGEHERAARFRDAITRAESDSPAPALTDTLLMDLSEANAAADVATDAYELTRQAVERDTLAKKLRKNVAVELVAIDALEAGKQ